MAFYEWDENNQNSYTASEFEDVNSRENGFQPGTPISSIEMNTALKQATIVACALMDSLGITTDNLGTDRATLATDILTGLNQGRANITGSYIPNTTESYDLGDNDHKWNNLFAKVINTSTFNCATASISGNTTISGALNVSGNIISSANVSDSVGTLADLRYQTLTVDRIALHSTEQEVSAIQTKLNNKHKSKSNVVNSNFTTNNITYCRSGNVVVVSFKGTNTQQANDFIIDSLSADEMAKFRPVSQMSGINIPLGTAVAQRGSDGADIGNVPLYIYYDSTNNNLKLKYVPKDGTSSLLLLSLQIFGTATYMAPENT